MKRSPLRKRSKNPLPRLKHKLWKVFARFIKLRDNFICFTCGEKVEGRNAQGGHYIPKAVSGLLLYFHEDNVHCQCSRCNLTFQGEQKIYGDKLGKEKVAELRALIHKPVKWTVEDYKWKIEYYTKACQTFTQAL